jgi:hypothetical protein
MMNPMMLLSTLLPALFNIGGSNGEMKSTYNQEQKGGINDILQAIKGMGGAGGANINTNPQYQQGNEWLQSLFNDEGFFKNFEAPAMRQFNEEIVPGVANRFASMGSGGALGSTGFRNQLAREGSNLETNLAAMRGGMQQNAIPQMFNSANMPFQNMMQMFNTGLGHPTENVYQPPSNPWAPVAGAGLQGYLQGQGMNNRFPGQNSSTM